jgi:hypothetical protein
MIAVAVTWKADGIVTVMQPRSSAAVAPGEATSRIVAVVPAVKPAGLRVNPHSVCAPKTTADGLASTIARRARIASGRLVEPPWTVDRRWSVNQATFR